MSVRALPLALPLLLLAGVAAAEPLASTWVATCSKKDEPTLWWMITAAEPPKALADFDCAQLFLDGAPCTHALGFGTVRALVDGTYGGLPVYELRYLPYGNATTILGFLDRNRDGVVYVPASGPADVSGAPVQGASTRADRAQLLHSYLLQRQRSSNVNRGTTLHVWTCPQAPVTLPEYELYELGMSVQWHLGRYVPR